MSIVFWSTRILTILLALSLFAGPCFAREARSGHPGANPLHSGRRLNTKPLPAPRGAVTMEDAVNRAIRNNPSLGAEEEQAKASEAGRKSARGAFGPRLGMTYSAIKQERDMSPSSVSERTPERGTYSWGVEISQPVFQGFRLLAAYQKAALQEESDRSSVRNAELAMTGKVQAAFLDYLRHAENARSSRESLERLEDQLYITQSFYEVGLRPHIDVLQAEVDVRKAENTVLQAENSRDTSLAQLNTLIGLPASSRVKYEGRLAYVPFSRGLEQCLAAAYRLRPDLHMAALAVDIAGKSQKEVQAGYYPQVEAYWNMTQTGNTPDLQEAGKYGSRAQTWEVGVKATWEVFQWGTTYYADKQAGHLVTKMRYAQEDLKLNVGYEVKSRLLAVREAAKRIKVSEKAVEQAQEAYAVAKARYSEQVGTNFDVLDASAKLTVAEADLTSARADYLGALSQLYVSMGEFHPNLLDR